MRTYIKLTFSAFLLVLFPLESSHADSDNNSRKTELDATVQRLLEACSRETGRAQRESYEAVKAQILSPPLRMKVDEVDSLYDRLIKADFEASKTGTDLAEVSMVSSNNMPADFILFTPAPLDSVTTGTGVRYSCFFDEARVNLLRDVPVEDDPGKVWSPYKQEIELFFRYVNGKWLLHEATFDIPEDYSGFSTLTKRLADRNSPERQALAQEWENKLSSLKKSLPGSGR